MTIKQVLLRFFYLYLGMTVVLGVINTFVPWPLSGLHVVIAGVSVYLASKLFIVSNQRLFSLKERNSLLIGFIFIHFLIKLVLGALFLVVQGGTHWGVFTIAFVSTEPMYVMIIVITAAVVKNQFYRQGLRESVH